MNEQNKQSVKNRKYTKITKDAPPILSPSEIKEKAIRDSIRKLKLLIISILILAFILLAVAFNLDPRSNSDLEKNPSYENSHNDTVKNSLKKLKKDKAKIDTTEKIPKEFKTYDDLRKGCFFNATAFADYVGNGGYGIYSMEEVKELMGEPEKVQDWSYQGIAKEYPVTSYYYNLKGGKTGEEPPLNFVFYNKTIMEIIVLQPITFENTDDLLKKFALAPTKESQVLIDNDEQFRIMECGIKDFWAYAIEYSKDKTRGDAYCYLRYLEL